MVVAIKVAIAIPDTGLLLLPTRPTIREETDAKKKPNTTTINAPERLIGISGRSHITTATAITPINTVFVEIFTSVLLPLSAFLPNPFIAFTKVLIITGRDFTRLKIPPAATAPAPM